MRPILCVLACLILAAPIFGCRYSEVRVTVPHGYRGQVILSCEAVSDSSTTGSVGISGSGSLPTCPSSRARVYVVQDGQATAVSDVQWNRTGDGRLTGIRFSVR
jgi:hypothetical protein